MNYKQYDSRWGYLGYPRKPWLIRNCGCGEVSVCNAIIEMATQANQTPKTIQPFMVKYAESHGNGTYHYGIPVAMKHYGLTEVMEHPTMPKLWKELAKGKRVAILLMGSRNAGSKGVHWTGSGHFVAVTDYKEKDGKHWLYVKDCASTSPYRDGWVTYEGNIRGACLKCWSGKISTKVKSPTFKATPDGKLTIDGVGGISTVKRMQEFFGTTIDGVIGGQNQSYAMYHPALKSVHYGKGGSPCVKKMQEWLGIKVSGIWGKGTSRSLQKRLGVAVDGYFGAKSMKAWQEYLNEHATAKYSLWSKLSDCSKAQAKWMKNYTYKWEDYPTLAKSKKYGTCVTYVACVLQRAGYLESGEAIWHTHGKVDGATYRMKVMYPKGTIKANKDKLKKGDVIIAGDPHSMEAGGDSHIFIFAGWADNGQPNIYDNNSANRVKNGKKPKHTYNGKANIIAVIRMK